MKQDEDAGGFTSIVGFDSAWTDNPKAPGAVCVVRFNGEGARLCVMPRLSSFREALEVIAHERTMAGKCVIAMV